MDVFKEQIVRKLSSRNDKISKVFIMIAAVALAMGCFMLTFGTQLMMFGLLFAALVLYGGYYFVTNLDVEYEYILTNGDLDVDKIIAQRKRKRLCTLKVTAATEFGPLSDSSNTSGAQTYVKASADDASQTDYFLRVNHKSLGDTVLIFTPNEEMLEEIMPYIPRNIARNIQK